MKAKILTILLMMGTITLTAGESLAAKKQKPLTFQQFIKGVKSIQKLEKEIQNKEKILLAMEQNLISKLEALKRGKKNLSKKKKQIEDLKSKSFNALIVVLDAIERKNNKQKEKKEE